MKLALLCLFSVFVACHPVAAQERYPEAAASTPFVEYYPADPNLWDDGEVGFFYFHNGLTLGHPDTMMLTIKTNVGDVIFELITTPNGDCETLCPDTLTVFDWPTGYSVHPMSITVPEMSMGTITLFENFSS